MNYRYIAAFLTVLFLSGCGVFLKPKEVTVIDKQLVPVTIHGRSFEVPAVPDPIKREELDPKDPRKNYTVFGTHIEILYVHISALENQIRTIQRTMQEQAKRITESNKP